VVERRFVLFLSCFGSGHKFQNDKSANGFLLFTDLTGAVSSIALGSDLSVVKLGEKTSLGINSGEIG